MLKLFIILSATALFTTSAFAEDTKLNELVYLVLSSEKCGLTLNNPAKSLIDGITAKVDQATLKTVSNSQSKLVENELKTQGPATFCWGTWQKLRDNGFLLQ